MVKQPDTVTAFLDEIDRAAGADRRLDAAAADLRREFDDLDAMQYRARRVVGLMAQLLQASLLVRNGHPAVADAFVVSRLGNDRGDVFGTLPTGVDTASIIERVIPKTMQENAHG